MPIPSIPASLHPSTPLSICYLSSIYLSSAVHKVWEAVFAAYSNNSSFWRMTVTINELESPRSSA